MVDVQKKLQDLSEEFQKIQTGTKLVGFRDSCHTRR